jgi:hypothetical protein
MHEYYMHREVERKRKKLSGDDVIIVGESPWVLYTV